MVVPSLVEINLKGRRKRDNGEKLVFSRMIFLVVPTTSVHSLVVYQGYSIMKYETSKT